jgi:CheY-like chemotaxis protein
MKRYVVMVRTDIDDRDLTLAAINTVGHEIDIDFVSSPNELETIIESKGEPSVILLNDNDSVKKGYDQVRELKQRSLLAHIPIIILGEKSTREYIRKCYAAGANSFITKPSTVKETNQKIARFFDYWFEVADV